MNKNEFIAREAWKAVKIKPTNTNLRWGAYTINKYFGVALNPRKGWRSNFLIVCATVDIEIDLLVIYVTISSEGIIL